MRGENYSGRGSQLCVAVATVMDVIPLSLSLSVGGSLFLLWQLDPQHMCFRKVLQNTFHRPFLSHLSGNIKVLEKAYLVMISFVLKVIQEEFMQHLLLIRMTIQC